MNANYLPLTRTRRFETNLANICSSHLQQSTSCLHFPATPPPNVINPLASSDLDAVQKSSLSLRLSRICSLLFLRTVFQLVHRLLLFVLVFFPFVFPCAWRRLFLLHVWGAALKPAPGLQRAAGCQGHCRADRGRLVQETPVLGVPLE